MRRFLVESYVPAPGAAELDELARRARAAELAEPAVRHLGSVLVAADEICFHVFEAPSAPALLRASDGAGLPHDRVVEAVWIPPPRR